MMSAAATDIIVEIINKIIDNIDKTVDDNKNIYITLQCFWMPGIEKPMF